MSQTEIAASPKFPREISQVSTARSADDQTPEDKEMPMRLVAIRSTIGVACCVTSIGLAGLATADPTDYHGDPDAGSTTWSQQTLDDCALMATAHLIGLFTDHTPTETEIIARAAATPSGIHAGSIYHLPGDPDHPNESGDGAATEDMPLLMKHYGLTGTYTDDDTAADVELPTGIDALKHYLDISKAVLAVADADTLWDDPEDYGPHAVVVTGIDDRAGIVHINDSGPDDGADEQVAIADFDNAWGKYGHQLVVVTE